MKKLKGFPAIFIPFVGLACLLLGIQSFAAEEQRVDVPLDASIRFGPPDAPVTMIEFLDFQ